VIIGSGSKNYPNVATLVGLLLDPQTRMLVQYRVAHLDGLTPALRGGSGFGRGTTFGFSRPDQ
jgi:hypothetical protein